MSWNEQSLSPSFMSALWPRVTLCLHFALSSPLYTEETHPSWAKCMRGVFTTDDPVFCPVIGRHKTFTSLKPDAAFFPPFTQHNSVKNSRYRGTAVQTCWEITRLGLRMPAYSTNMRLKFPIVALILEFITIILFAVFVVYDDGKGQGHGHNSTDPEKEEPMDRYPSKSTGAAFLRDALQMDASVLVIRVDLVFVASKGYKTPHVLHPY